jgi:hypothetical protein
MRVIVSKRTSPPGRSAAVHQHRRARFTAFATDAKKGQLADLELRHRRRARCEDRIRCAKDTGLRNLPLKGFAQNQLWCEIVSLACELLAWTQLLALTGPARRWEPKRLRLRVLSVAGRLAAEAAACGSGSPNAGPGPTRSPPRSPGCRPSRPADQPEPSRRHGRSNPGPVEPRPPGATAGQPGIARTRKPTPAEHPRPPDHGRERSRLIQQEPSTFLNSDIRRRSLTYCC